MRNCEYNGGDCTRERCIGGRCQAMVLADDFRERMIAAPSQGTSVAGVDAGRAPLTIDRVNANIQAAIDASRSRQERGLEPAPKCFHCGLPQAECDYQKNFPDPEPFV